MNEAGGETGPVWECRCCQKSRCMPNCRTRWSKPSLPVPFVLVIVVYPPRLRMLRSAHRVYVRNTAGDAPGIVTDALSRAQDEVLFQPVGHPHSRRKQFLAGLEAAILRGIADSADHQRVNWYREK